MVPFGVWIGKEVEWVVVDRYILAFRKIIEQDCLEACLLSKDNAAGQYRCAGICRSYPIHSQVNCQPRRWEFAFAGQNRVYANNAALKHCIGQEILTTTAAGEGLEIQYWDDRRYSATADESFSMAEINPPAPAIAAENIGECLRCWSMGCLEESITVGEDRFSSVTINTAKHMYIFQMLPGSFYCRAARYATSNRGVLFFQNFRQRKSATPETYMAEDNRIALQPLSVRESDFDAFACSLVTPEAIAKKYLDDRQRTILGYRYGVMGCAKLSQRKTAQLLGISPSSVGRLGRQAETILFSHMPNNRGEGIYWIVTSFSDSRITLNGCQGDVYQWDKPVR
jgi:hypothetical protein